MKKTVVLTAALAVAATSVPFTSNAIAGRGTSEKYESYEQLDESHVLCEQGSYAAKKGLPYAVYVSPDDETVDGFTIIKANRNNDLLGIKLADGISAEDVKAAADGIAADWDFSASVVGWGGRADCVFSAAKITPNDAKALSDTLKAQGLIDGCVLHFDEWGETYVEVDYPLNYADAALMDSVADILPDCTVTADGLGGFSVACDAAADTNAILAAADMIYEETGSMPVYNMPEFGGSTGASEIDIYAAVEGDANGDSQVNVADSVKILQYIANAEKYPLDIQGRFNADCDGADGITGADAETIMKIDAKVL